MFRTDHPRSCGANDGVPRRAHMGSGSSPLVRGQRTRPESARRPGRIIPARAGPTLRKACFRGGLTDHPRSCGANASNATDNQFETGSSPLVRGQPQVRDLKRAKNRIIPARAGPTRRSSVLSAVFSDHPRSCGANCETDTIEQCNSGSSPLVRGQRQLIHRGFRHGRIIPARAGPTCPSMIAC